MKSENQNPRSEIQNQRRSWVRQTLGALLGAGVGWLAAGFAPRWGLTLREPTRLVLWGAALGALLASLDRFILAGSRLSGRTGKQAALLNFALALLGGAVIFGLLLGILYLVGLFLP